MGLKTTTDEAIDKYREAKRASTEANSEVAVAQQRLEAARGRAAVCLSAFTTAHRALIDAVGTLDEDE